jgi:hypothetical protein
LSAVVTYFLPGVFQHRPFSESHSRQINGRIGATALGLPFHDRPPSASAPLNTPPNAPESILINSKREKGLGDAPFILSQFEKKINSLK